MLIKSVKLVLLFIYLLVSFGQCQLSYTSLGAFQRYEQSKWPHFLANLYNKVATVFLCHRVPTKLCLRTLSTSSLRCLRMECFLGSTVTNSSDNISAIFSFKTRDSSSSLPSTLVLLTLYSWSSWSSSSFLNTRSSDLVLAVFILSPLNTRSSDLVLMVFVLSPQHSLFQPCPGSPRSSSYLPSTLALLTLSSRSSSSPLNTRSSDLVVAVWTASVKTQLVASRPH